MDLSPRQFHLKRHKVNNSIFTHLFIDVDHVKFDCFVVQCNINLLSNAYINPTVYMDV